MRNQPLIPNIAISYEIKLDPLQQFKNTQKGSNSHPQIDSFSNTPLLYDAENRNKHKLETVIEEASWRRRRGDVPLLKLSKYWR